MISTAWPEKSVESATGSIRWHTERCTLIIKNRIVKLTTTEYQLLFPLRYNLPVAYKDLASIVYECDMDDKVRLMLDKHVDRIRGKMRGTGYYVYCILSYGYILLPEDYPHREA
jgi:DNA-binding response OmpR family regulator